MNEAYIKHVFDLGNKTAVVTGAGSGIGQGIAIALANFGAHVVLTGRRIERLEKTSAQIEGMGGSANCLAADVRNKAEMEQAIRSVKEKRGSVDIFVANAGFNVRAELLDTTEEEIDALLATDYKGTLYGVMEAGRVMKEQKSGNIVIISSINGVSAMGNLAVYSSIKYALEGVVRSLAASLGPYGVRVNSCAPGVILSEMNQEIYSNERNREAKLSTIPLRTLGVPMDIGNVVACMVSDGFRFMTGTTVLVDGGELLRPMQRQERV